MLLWWSKAFSCPDMVTCSAATHPTVTSKQESVVYEMKLNMEGYTIVGPNKDSCIHAWVYMFMHHRVSATWAIDPIHDLSSPIAIHVAMGGLVCSNQLGPTPWVLDWTHQPFNVIATLMKALTQESTKCYSRHELFWANLLNSEPATFDCYSFNDYSILNC